VGRNSRQNDAITFGLAKPSDLWFHARGVAGSHVLLRLDPGAPQPSTQQRQVCLSGDSTPSGDLLVSQRACRRDQPQLSTPLTRSLALSLSRRITISFMFIVALFGSTLHSPR
jgi:hypothetical protein